MTYFSQLPGPGSTPLKIGFLGFDGMSVLDLTGPLEAFAAARREDDDNALLRDRPRRGRRKDVRGPVRRHLQGEIHDRERAHF